MEGVKFNDNKHKNFYGVVRRAGRVCWLYMAGFKIRRENNKMTMCSCWVQYPNKCYKKDNGKWKCIDRYKCVRNYDGRRKTVCEKIEDKKGEKNNDN